MREACVTCNNQHGDIFHAFNGATFNYSEKKLRQIIEENNIEQARAVLNEIKAGSQACMFMENYLFIRELVFKSSLILSDPRLIEIKVGLELPTYSHLIINTHMSL